MNRLRDRWTRRKSLAEVRADIHGHGLQRKLGPWHLVMLGIGCTIGAGVFIMTGSAAADYAGAGVVLAFALAGLACGLTGLCYAELASMLPVSGASYTYLYVARGEIHAWALGWLLMMEYGLAGALLAVGLSGYLASLLGDFGVLMPAFIHTPLVVGVAEHGGVTFHVGGGLNIVAAACLMFFASILVRGVTQSARTNAIMVGVKLVVLVLFVIVGAWFVDSANWAPLVPASQGGFHYGALGVLRAASILFFAYLGFETVSAAALEARNPQRDLPIGILGSLLVCTVVYIAVGLVLTGLVPYPQLDVTDPISLAVAKIDIPGLSLLIDFGAVAALCSVLIVNTYAQSRICYAMSRDGLLPPLFERVHKRFGTPYKGIVAVAGTSAVAAMVLPISILGDLVSLAVTLAFAAVAMSVIWLRQRYPDVERPFRVPLGGVRVGGVWVGTVPVLALVLCLGLAGLVLYSMVVKAVHGDTIPVGVLLIYLLLGAWIYLRYGYRHSRASGPGDPRNESARTA